MSRTEYSDEFKADALALLDANRGNIALTAAQLGVPYTTLHNWKNGLGVSEEITELGNKKKGVLADKIEELAWDLLNDLFDEGKRTHASLSQVSTSFGIAVDKMRLLRGESTDIQEVRDADRARSRLLERIKKHHSFGQSATGEA